MSFAARVNSRVTHAAVGRHLPYRTVRARLTLLYGGLFLLSGAALMAITYALLVNAGFVFSLQNGTTIASGQSGSVSAPPSGGLPLPGAITRPSARAMAQWLGVAQCMRQHGVSRFPNPTTSVPKNLASVGSVDDRDGAIIVIPYTVNQESPAFIHAATACGFMDGNQIAQDNRQRAGTRQQLLVQSGIALAGMSLLSLALGWLVAGRVLQPLEDSYQAQRQFVANASHELRAPLTRQRALIEVTLASSEADFDSLRKAHERVLASEQQLEQLIDSLLALTRGQAGLQHREPLDLGTLTSQAMLARESELADLDLNVQAALNPAPTAGDPRLVEGLIANLIDNAIRHNTPGGHVDISTGTRDRHAFVSISNTGQSVPPEQIERLFQPFERLEARTRHDSGHGLGLSIVQAIAKVHRAEVSARAQPDGGLTIEVLFGPATATKSGVVFATGWAKRRGPRPSLGE
jgi:signal transduction histidine kinase